MRLSLNSVAAFLLSIGLATANSCIAQIDESQLGAWYAYAFSHRFDNSRFGLQGDTQLRNWDILGDVEQYLARGALTFSPENQAHQYSAGIASVTSLEFGDSDASNTENRIFQDVSIPQKIGRRVLLRHRLRTEQRWIENQDFRTRYRYLLSATIPINRDELTAGVWFWSVNNEIFFNGERNIGNGRRVDYFDRNRSYVGLGKRLSGGINVQIGYMHQWIDDLHKGQLQVRLSQTF